MAPGASLVLHRAAVSIRRRPALAAALALAAACRHGAERPVRASAAPSRPPLVYVTNEGSGDLTVIDVGADEVVGTVKLGKPQFAGRSVLVGQKERGLARKLVGLEAEGRRVPRHGMPIEIGNRAVGVVTSGTFAPSLEKAIAMAYVEVGAGAIGTAVEVVAGTARIPARVVKRPFYTRGTHR